MPFAVAAAAVGTGTSIYEGMQGAKAAKSAAKTESDAFAQASQLERDQFAQTQQNLSPYMAGGTNALTALQKMLGIGPGGGGASSPILQMLGIGGPGGTGAGNINPATFQGSPGYQYQVQQGNQAVTNQAAAAGGIGGNALKALQSTGQGLANQNWGNYLNQSNTAYQQLIANLGGLVGGGQSAATNLGKFGADLGAQLGGNATGAADATASGILGANNAMMGGISGAANSVISGINGPGGMGGGGQSQLARLLASLFGGNGADASAEAQYANPYGATGNGMAPIVGSSGMMGGGV